MSPTRERQRAAARARLEREMTARAEAARKRRQRNAYVGAGLAVLLLLVGGTWLGMTLARKPDKKAATPAPAAAAGCQWLPDSATQNPNIKDVGTPPTDVPRAGKQPMTLQTNLGIVEFEMDVKGAPCTSASMAYLAGKKFFDNSKCHRLVTKGFKILQCGDPTATGSGGPSYKMAEENLPTDQNPTYVRGMVAMAKTSEANSTGSQFFLIDQDISATNLPAQYTVLGKITKGLDVLDKIVTAGAVGPDGKVADDGKPKIEVVITSATVGPIVSG
jgi:peptidyl-prolyl cis-trans isomerase B (cyclophilin B)